MTCERCESPMTRAVRYGPTPEPVPVFVCLNCAYETPPLACCPSGSLIATVRCVVCDGVIVVEASRAPQRRYCSKRCKRIRYWSPGRHLLEGVA